MAYTTIAVIRAKGIAIGEVTDADVTTAIAWAESYIDFYTGFHFEAVAYTALAPLKLDGNGTDVLELPLPVSPVADSLTSITMDGAEVDLDSIINYNRLRPDDRKYPRLEWDQSLDEMDKALGYGSAWTLGRQNISLVGSFGYLGATGLILPDVADLAAWVVIFKLAMDGSATAGGLLASIMDSEITKEATRDRSVEYKGAQGGIGAETRSKPTGYLAIDEVIARHRRIK